MSAMSAARSSSCKLRGLVTLLYRYKVSSSPNPPYYVYNRDFLSSSSEFGHGSCMNQGLRFFSGNNTSSKAFGKPNSDRVKDEGNNVEPPRPPSSQSGFSTWAKWLLGAVMALLFPFWKQKWQSLLGLEGKVEQVVEDVEVVADVVEKVAAVAETVSAEVAQQFPENGIIQKAATAVEHMSSVTAADVHLTKDVIHKVEVVKQDLKDLETMVEPVIEKIIDPVIEKIIKEENPNK